MDYKVLARDILDNLGGKDNIKSFTNCMTRLRLEVKDSDRVNSDRIQGIKEVLGFVNGEQIQIILGVGHAQRTKDELEKLVKSKSNSELKKEVINNNRFFFSFSFLRKFLRSIGNIFIPLIPGFIGIGLVNFIANVWRTLNSEAVNNSWYIVLITIVSLFFNFLNILVAYNAGKEFGGTPVLGVIAGFLPEIPNLLDLSIFDNLINKIMKISPRSDGTLGVILSVWFFVLVEKKLRKIIPAKFDLILVPLLTILIAGFISITIIMPVSLLIMRGMVFIILDILINYCGALGGYILAASFLPLVMLGLHQSLMPIHVYMIQNFGYTMLFPILAMAGAGRIGAVIAVLFKTKDITLKNKIKKALPAGIFGIGEPLIYGFSKNTLITTCLGAGFGGAVLASVKDIGSTTVGTSGLLLIPLLNNKRSLIWYIVAILCSYIGGFLLTYFFGYKETEEKIEYRPSNKIKRLN